MKKKEKHPLELWVEDLESGNNQQARRHLHAIGADPSQDSFCCLGRLCAVAIKHGSLSIEGVGPMPGITYPQLMMYEGRAGTPPDEVTQWAGLSNREIEEYIHMNDSVQASFKEIAARVRKNHPEVFGE